MCQLCRQALPIAHQRFSRSEQLRQALAQNPEARYSKDELSIADAFEDLPEDMRRRLGTGEKVGE